MKSCVVILFLSILSCCRSHTESNYRCYTPWQERKTCIAGFVQWNSADCEAAGCCYNDSAYAYSAPKCFKATVLPEQHGTSYNRESSNALPEQHGPSHNREPSNDLSDNRDMLYFRGSSDAALVYPTRPANHYGYQNVEDVPYLFRRHESVGRADMLAVCHLGYAYPYRYRRSCGPTHDTNRQQCIRFGCCWRKEKNPAIPPCFHAQRYITRKQEPGKVDVVFVIDTRGRLAEQAANKGAINTWFKFFTGLLKISNGEIQVGAAYNSRRCRNSIRLGEYKDQAKLNAAIDAITAGTGCRPISTFVAISIAIGRLQRSPRDARKVLVVITDGFGAPRGWQFFIRFIMRRFNIEILGVGVGSNVGNSLTRIITDPLKISSSPTYSLGDNVKFNLLNAIGTQCK